MPDLTLIVIAVVSFGALIFGSRRISGDEPWETVKLVLFYVVLVAVAIVIGAMFPQCFSDLPDFTPWP